MNRRDFLRIAALAAAGAVATQALGPAEVETADVSASGYVEGTSPGLWYSPDGTEWFEITGGTLTIEPMGASDLKRPTRTFTIGDGWENSEFSTTCSANVYDDMLAAFETARKEG